MRKHELCDRGWCPFIHVVGIFFWGGGGGGCKNVVVKLKTTLFTHDVQSRFHVIYMYICVSVVVQKA